MRRMPSRSSICLAAVATVALQSGALGALTFSPNQPTVDGGSSTTVLPGATIAVQVFVRTSSNTDWDSTRWTISGGGGTACVDHANHTANNTDYTESFNITAPNTDGAYDLTILVASNDSCGGTTNTTTLTGAIIVASPKGACCLPSGSCQILTSSACSAQSGCYQGDNTSCGAGTATTYTKTHSPGLAITDNNAAGVNSTLVINDSYVIGDVDVELNITHTFQGDIAVKLIAPGGSATVTLVNRPGQPQSTNGFSADNFGNSGTSTPFVLDDSAANTYDVPTVTAPGTNNVTSSWKPDPGSLAALNGLNVNGTWTLNVSDNASADTGTLTRWSLVAKQIACPAIVTQPVNATACEDGSASFTVVASGANLTYQWRRNTVPLSNGGAISGATSATLTIDPVAAPNAGSYDVVLTSGSCTKTSTVATLTVVAKPTASAGGPYSACDTNAVPLSGSASNQSSVSWSTPDGTGSFTNGNTLTATYNPSAADVAAGTRTLRLTVNGNSPCAAAVSDATLTLTANPTTATVGGPQTICALGTTAGLGGNTPGVGIGAWSVVSGGTGTFNPNNLDPNATFAHLTGTGPIVVRWTITNAPCTASTADVTITINQSPTTATVGGNQTICALGTTAGLGGNAPSVGTGAWSVESGGTGTFNPNHTTPNATFTHTGGAGPVVLRWTISNAPCIASTADVTITIIQSPSIGLTVSPASTTVCTGSTVNVTITNAESGVSYQLFDTTANANSGSPDTGSGVNLVLTSAALTASTTLQVKATLAPCATVTLTDSVAVTVNPSPSIGLTVSPASTTICSGSTVNVTITNAESGVSYQLFDTTASANSGSPDTGSGVNLVLTSAPLTASTTLQVKATLAPCATVTLTHSTAVTVNAAPSTASVGDAQTICTLGTTAGLGGNAPTTGTGVWSVESGGTGTFNPNASDPNATFTHATGAGPIVLRWTISNPPCTASYAEVSITIEAQPVVPDSASADPDSFCTKDAPKEISLTATGGSGATLHWFDDTCGGNEIGTGSPLVIDAPTATTTYYVRWENGCGESTCAEATVTVNDSPTASASNDGPVCSGSDVHLSSSPSDMETYAWTGPGGFTSSDQNATVSPAEAGQYCVTVTNSAGCSDTACTDVVVNDPPSTATVGGPQTICTLGTTAGLGGNAPSVGTGAWSVVSGGTGSFNPDNLDPNATFTHAAGTGPVVVRWTISNPPCTDSYAEVTITINQNPTTATVGGPQTICVNGTTSGLGGNTPLVGTGSWSVVTGGFTGTFNPSNTAPNATFTQTGGGAGNIVLRWTISNPPCTASSADVTIAANSLVNIDVTVELGGGMVSTGPFTRCITFEYWNPGVNPTTPLYSSNELLTFTSGSSGTVTLAIPCEAAGYTCMTARDRLHTLRRTVTLSGPTYVANFTASDGKALIGGNLNDSRFIDIVDFGIFTTQDMSNVGANTTCGMMPPATRHADVSGDGTVESTDFAFISNNFLAVRDGNCGGNPNSLIAEEQPISRISVAELRQQGLGDLVRSDLNHDGWLDQQDVMLWMQGVRPSDPPTPAGPRPGRPIQVTPGPTAPIEDGSTPSNGVQGK